MIPKMSLENSGLIWELKVLKSFRYRHLLYIGWDLRQL